MQERLWERRQKLVEEGAQMVKDDRETLEDFVGPGGVKLNLDEQFQLYQQALSDVGVMLGVLQNRQAYWNLQPDQAPKDWVRWLQRMQARDATTLPVAKVEPLDQGQG